MNRSFMHKIMAALFTIVIIATAQAQAPQKFNYQAALRTNNNVPIINTPVAVRISIVKDSALGSVVYTETQTTTSNSNGVISLQIGTGKAVSGNFTTINWGAGNYYVKTETDPSGGTNYTTSGTAQLLSVPYALYAANSGTTGAAGKDGVSVSATKIIKDSLFVTLSNGQTLNAGNVRGAQGIQGIQGLTGLTGAKGDSGARGLQGVQGIQGLKGDQGIQGIQGLTGATGLKGDSGARGLQGIQGIQGLKGDQGIQGIQGLTGATGAKGDSGARGLQGIQGIQGLKGDQGIQGIQGLTGLTGAKGDSGARGLQGIQGTQGLKGDQGIQGIQGLTGATGLKGDSGARGLQGIQGIQGLKGDQGIQGIQGLTGLTGAIGKDGVTGKDGVSITKTKVTGDSLFITLSNGQTLNAGNVRGPQGFLSTTGNKKGGMLYWNGTTWDTIAVGISGQYLQMNSSTVPTWTTPAPVSNFTYSGTSQAPATVIFTNNSINANSYSWDFGDSTTSVLQNPTHTYSIGGVYNVKLAAKTGVNTSYSSFPIAIQNAASLQLSITDNLGKIVSGAQVKLYKTYTDYLNQTNQIDVTKTSDVNGIVLYYGLSNIIYYFSVNSGCLSNNLGITSIGSSLVSNTTSSLTIPLSGYGTIKLTSTSTNPYKVFVDGNVYISSMTGGSTRYLYYPVGSCTVRVLQLSGYLFSATDESFPINLTCGGMTSITFP